jgi:hypothetical protein
MIVEISVQITLALQFFGPEPGWLGASFGKRISYVRIIMARSIIMDIISLLCLFLELMFYVTSKNNYISLENILLNQYSP